MRYLILSCLCLCFGLSAHADDFSLSKVMRDYGRQLLAANMVALRCSATDSELAHAIEGLDAAIFATDRLIQADRCQKMLVPRRTSRLSDEERTAYLEKFYFYLEQFALQLQQYKTMFEALAAEPAGTRNYLILKAKAEEIKTLVNAAHANL